MKNYEVKIVGVSRDTQKRKQVMLFICQCADFSDAEDNAKVWAATTGRIDDVEVTAMKRSEVCKLHYNSLRDYLYKVTMTEQDTEVEVKFTMLISADTTAEAELKAKQEHPHGIVRKIEQSQIEDVQFTLEHKAEEVKQLIDKQPKN